MSLDLNLPPGFLWGASSSAHQTEGNNTNSNWWHMENHPQSPFKERSGRALDSYHRYREDMTLLAGAGLDTYRFSIEWARIEPTPGDFSVYELAHYRDMIRTAGELGLTPVVTLHHFTTPAWFAKAGGWRAPTAVDRFARYVEEVTPILGDVPWICTINEPNMVALFGGLNSDNSASQNQQLDERAVTALAAPAPSSEVARILIDAHGRASDILHATTDARVGWTISNQAFESTPGHEEAFTAAKWVWEDQFLTASRGDDFVGVQSYTTRSVGADGPLPYPDDESHTQTGWPNRPDALGIAIRNTWDITQGTPILVTENGIATDDDDERIAYTSAALLALNKAVQDGIDVCGYLHWSALDNYEWGEWDHTFGLIEVDRRTFERHPRPSLYWLGNVARQQRNQTAARITAER